jgi:G3E family GTPase
VDPADLLDTSRFDLKQTQRGAQVYHHFEQTHDHQEHHGDHHHHHKGYGLSTVVFRARQPANQRDLFRVLRSELPGLIRAKGFYWTAEDPEQCGILSLADGVLRADRAGPWFIDMLRQGRVTMDEMPPTIRAAWQDSPLGDRRQEIVLIGVNLDEEDVLSRLNATLA